MKSLKILYLEPRGMFSIENLHGYPLQMNKI